MAIEPLFRRLLHRAFGSMSRIAISARIMPVRPSSKVTSVSTAMRSVRVQRLDQLVVTLIDDAAAHLARARELAVVGIEPL